ncbi:MAG: group II intron reverse transcriptase/maturase [Spirochaetaceae bacterium]|nr:group II intron reverse transcriptase/maturase [Spirochaetaceae bacterium]
MSEISKPNAGKEGRNPDNMALGVSNSEDVKDGICPVTDNLLERMVEKPNMMEAYRKVVGNRGSAGVDKMTVDDLKAHLQKNWESIRKALVEGRYIPQPVLRVEIPKLGGKGVRLLGIPTVTDRLIQQALHQVLSPMFDGDFSEHSYGFRPGRSAHQAVKAAQSYVAEGKRWVVDLDLEKFFDRVNHDILMSRVARKVKDTRVLTLIRRYLKAGIMVDGVTSVPQQGTPQGGPLSPLLSNILLDDLDKELEKRNLRFCRYADDCSIYVGSQKAGERVLESITRFLEKKLKLKDNKEKSRVERPWNCRFLGYSMTFHMKPRLKVSLESVKRLKAKVKVILRMGRGRSLSRTIESLKNVLRGWFNYFRLAEVKNVFEDLDGWLRRRLRCILWRQWKKGRTRYKKLLGRGLSPERARASAFNGYGAWWNAGQSHMNQAFPKKYFDSLGMYSFVDNLLTYRNGLRTAVVRNRMPGGVGGR